MAGNGLGEVSEHVRAHITECDRMYEEIHGAESFLPECNVCKKLLSMGFNLTSENMPDLCIHHCQRWRIASENIFDELGVENQGCGGLEPVLSGFKKEKPPKSFASVYGADGL